MRIRQIKFDTVLFTLDNARVWNNQKSPYWPSYFGGQFTDPNHAISQSWRNEIGERAFAAYFTEIAVGRENYSNVILNSTRDFRPENNNDGQDY